MSREENVIKLLAKLKYIIGKGGATGGDIRVPLLVVIICKTVR